MTGKTVLLLVSWSLIAPRVAHTQSANAAVSPTAQVDSSRTALIAALHSAAEANQMVRFTSMSGREISGRLSFMSDSLVRVATRPFDLRQLSKLEVRLTRNDPVWDGAAIGAAIGLPIGYLVYGLATSVSDQHPRGHTAIVVSVGGAAWGALIGAIVDGSIGETADWRTIWRRQTR